MRADDTYISHGFHLGLQPGSATIVEAEFDTNLFDPPGWTLGQLPLNVAYQKRMLVDPCLS